MRYLYFPCLCRSYCQFSEQKITDINLIKSGIIVTAKLLITIDIKGRCRPTGSSVWLGYLVIFIFTIF